MKKYYIEKETIELYGYNTRATLTKDEIYDEYMETIRDHFPETTEFDDLESAKAEFDKLNPDAWYEKGNTGWLLKYEVFELEMTDEEEGICETLEVKNCGIAGDDRFVIRDREAGNFINEYGTFEEAIDDLKAFVEEDLEDGNAESEEDAYNFYEIYDSLKEEIVTVYSKIKRLRESKGLSRKDVNELIGIPTRTLQDWELGLHYPPEWVQKLVFYRLNQENKGDH